MFGRFATYLRERKLRKRIEDYEKKEIKFFVAQKLFKVDGIIFDKQARQLFVDQLLLPHAQDRLNDDDRTEMVLKYGQDLTDWAYDRLNGELTDSSYMIQDAAADYRHMKEVDPLLNWFNNKPTERDRILTRIQQFAETMANMVGFSLLIDPGHLRAHLSLFADEFKELESMLDTVDLTPAESARRSFDANYLSKARDNKLECADFTRVVLRLPGALTDGDGDLNSLSPKQPADIFGDLDCPSVCAKLDYGTDDFIHANYVKGGSLLNTFICTQAPMNNTVADFWRMVWQEKPEYIFMLCDAVDTEKLSAFGFDQTKYCPIYWPKRLGETLQFGSLIIKNENILGALDPVFAVTELTMHNVNYPDQVYRFQHWRYDWRDYRDVQWPLRLLRRARISPRPTVVHCLDGCSRTGTFVFIEVLLMQVLRGTVNYANPGLTCGLFVRLQRRHAIGNYIQYLFAYRTVLHWIQPYVFSLYQRYALGLMFENSGFIGKFDELAQNWARQISLQ